MKDILYRWLVAYLGWAGFILYGGGKGSSPDYGAAAAQQGQSSKEVTNMQTWANRPDINTPFGKSTWDSSATVDPATGQPVTKWTQNLNLTPEQQAAADAQQRIQMGRSGLAEGLMGQVGEATKTPFDWSHLPEMPGSIQDAQKRAFQTMSESLQPGRQQREQSMQARLLASGLPEGSKPWQRAGQELQGQFTQEDKAMMGQAMGQGLADVSGQLGLRGASIAEQAQKRGMSLNELNALLTGQQVNMPQIQGAPSATAAGAQPVQSLTAAQLQGSQGGQNWGSAVGGLAQVAGAAAPFMGFSDVRLKKNITPIGNGWYEFEYIWDSVKRIGVLAQEVLLTNPAAVHVHPSGFLMVNYGAL